MVDSFEKNFSQLSSEFPASIKPTFAYHKGWSEDLTLTEHLAKNLDYCRRMGVTTAGPHRADLKIRIGKNEARYINSRGQQKLLAILMRLVQVQLYSDFHDQPPILLFDDLPSELDKKARAFVFKFLSESQVQVLLTSVEDVSKEIHSVNTSFTWNKVKSKSVILGSSN